MTTHWWRYSRLTATGFVTVVLVTLTACGSSGTPSAAPSASSSGSLSVLATCLEAHGVQVATPLSRKAIHSALKGASKPVRKAADAACDQYEAGVLSLPKKK